MKVLSIFPKKKIGVKTVRVLKQKGKSNTQADKKRKARLPGKRISGSGKVYWETRKNRSDRRGSKV